MAKIVLDADGNYIVDPGEPRKRKKREITDISHIPESAMEGFMKGVMPTVEETMGKCGGGGMGRVIAHAVCSSHAGPTAFDEIAHIAMKGNDYASPFLKDHDLRGSDEDDLSFISVSLAKLCPDLVKVDERNRARDICRTPAGEALLTQSQKIPWKDLLQIGINLAATERIGYSGGYREKDKESVRPIGKQYSKESRYSYMRRLIYEAHNVRHDDGFQVIANEILRVTGKQVTWNETIPTESFCGLN